MLIDHPARHILRGSPARGLGRVALWSRHQPRAWLGLELAVGVGCEVAIELVSNSVLDLNVVSGLGLEAAVAVGLGLLFGLRKVH